MQPAQIKPVSRFKQDQAKCDVGKQQYIARADFGKQTQLCRAADEADQRVGTYTRQMPYSANQFSKYPSYQNDGSPGKFSGKVDECHS